MQIFDIRPFMGVGPIDLGMSRNEVRKVVGAPVHTFKKTPVDDELTDAFRSLGVHVFYKRPGVCESIEFYGPANPMFNGVPILGSTLDNISRIFATQNVKVEKRRDAIVAHPLGFGVAAPKHQNGIISEVIVFENGYYDPQRIADYEEKLRAFYGVPKKH
jgi:hypothetical protein